MDDTGYNNNDDKNISVTAEHCNKRRCHTVILHYDIDKERLASFSYPRITGIVFNPGNSKHC